MTGAGPHLRGWSAVPCLLVVALAGCGDDPAPTPPASPDPPEAAIERHGGTEEAAAEVAEAPPAVLVRSEGDVQVGTGVPREHLPLERGERLVVGAGGHADVDLREGGRLSFEAGSDVRVGDIGPARILLVTGAVHVANPPEDGPRAVLRIATPEATIAMSGPGEIYAAVHPSGTTVLMALSGMFTISTGETDPRGRLREVDLTAGHSMVVAQRMSEPVEGPARLEDARTQAAALLAASTPEADAARRRDLGTAIGRLDEALGALEAEARHGGELTEQHRAAVAAANHEEAMRLQGELVAHSTALYRLREVATSRWERVRVLALTVTEVLEPDPIAVRSERVHGLLGE